MIYRNPEISALFNEETIHVLDYDCEYDRTIDYEKFPEYNNKVWRKNLLVLFNFQNSSTLIPP